MRHRGMARGVIDVPTNVWAELLGQISWESSVRGEGLQYYCVSSACVLSALKGCFFDVKPKGVAMRGKSPKIAVELGGCPVLNLS